MYCVRSDTLGCHPAAVCHWSCMPLKLLSTARIISGSVQKARAQSFRCRGATRANACPLSPLFTVTLCVKATDLTTRPCFCTSRVSSQACRACAADHVRAVMGARLHGWARGSRRNLLCPCSSTRRIASFIELCYHHSYVSRVALQLLLVQWRLHTVCSESWSSCGAQESHGIARCEA